jgi:hypothetical protein
MFGKSYKGYYKGNYLRSYGELILAMYLDLVENKKFRSEGVVLRDKDGRKKIPDFIILDENDNIIEYIEYKNSFREFELLLNEYIIRKIDLKGIKIRFLYSCKNSRKYLIKLITEKIGLEEFIRITTEYKEISPKIKIQSFPGELNGMYGKKHSKETRDLISKSCARPGELNGMYGKTHTKETRDCISENSQWKIIDEKKRMQQKGLIKHYSGFTDVDQKELLSKYINNILNDIRCKMPNFINRAYSLRKDKIIDLFESVAAFKIKMKELNYAIK